MSCSVGDGTGYVIEDAIQPKEPPMYIDARLPPVLPKLVKRMKDGQFIHMAELLATMLQHLPDLAVISRSAPRRTLDLLGYQTR